MCNEKHTRNGSFQVISKFPETHRQATMYWCHVQTRDWLWWVCLGLVRGTMVSIIYLQQLSTRKYGEITENLYFPHTLERRLEPLCSDWDNISALCSSVKGPILISWLKQRLTVGGRPSELSAAATNRTWCLIFPVSLTSCIRKAQE